MTDLTADQDAVRSYLCDLAPDARLMTVHLGETKNEMLDHQKMPTAAKTLCEELVAAACLLSHMLKFDGEMILQIKGSGPITMMVAECSSTGRIRSTAQWTEVGDASTFEDLVGTGYLAVTVNPRQGERYQGIVPLESGSISGCLNHYFKNSEQLDTKLWLASNQSTVGGLLIQRIPEEGGQSLQGYSNWETLSTLANTITDHELASDAGPLLIYKLFHELGPRSFDPWIIEFGCSCSKERSSRALRALGETELKKLFAEQLSLTLDCHFCGQVYQYDQADLEWLLSDQPPRPYTLQ
ncbi:MAG: Hsp33 family molecular chaperone HslO [Pseudomonadota bacterium]|nr:Hsp33 family molecular chaperone HslO [Pseudomonadota bacterium]